MRLLWAVPPSVLVVGSAAIALQLRRITAETAVLAREHRNVEQDRVALATVRQSLVTARASLDGLERR